MLAVGLLLACLAAAPPDAEQVARALDEVWAGSEYQRDLPDGPVHGTPPRAAREPRPAPAPNGGTGLATALLWVVAIGVAIVAALALVEGLRGRGDGARREAAIPGGPRAPPARAAVDAPLADAEALAREGRFAEGIHVLLLRLLHELSARTRPAIPDALTSREIVARVALPEGARPPLVDLVRAVEASHFGRADATASDYDRCLDRYRAFAAAYAGSAA